MSRLWFIHRIDRNIGDYLSGPYRYWEWGAHVIADICSEDAINRIERCDHVIVGGGGLMMPWFDLYRSRLLERKPSKVIWWGVGERRHENRIKGYLPLEEAGPPLGRDDFSPSHLVGIRTFTDSLQFVPCASCKLIESFVASHGWRRGHGISIFEHNDVRLGPGLPYKRLINRKCKPSAAIEFIAKTDILVTNSYHGMYWGSLLGKRVICVPFSSAHYHYPWPVAYTSPSNLKATIEKTRLTEMPSKTSRYLQLAVAANEAFRRRVMAFLSAK
ncbi:hypothetical protein [Synechococcus sp. CBW1004]|uniref:hypothetical protein n=1 Tax=Synechococcus sp. CBW1004 TaxID=1353136 RepID=UPI0018CCF418|nr:hypothetical protein [Synechococcus sp. CBW1004]QPN63165.1 hypothetical protein H8F25_16445 [Synechococcus sp. CBW1004]